MATIINESGRDRVVEVDRSGDTSGGWAVAVIVLVLVVAGLIGWYYYHHRAAPASGGTNINVVIPNPSNSNAPAQ